MHWLTIISMIVLLGAAMVHADLKPGDPLPNPTLTDKKGEQTVLHDLLNKVTVIHLWKCN